MVRDVIGGVTRSKLADRADPDEDFITSSDDEPSALAAIGIDATAIWDAVGAESTANGGVVERAEWVKHAKGIPVHDVTTLARAVDRFVDADEKKPK